MFSNDGPKEVTRHTFTTEKPWRDTFVFGGRQVRLPALNGRSADVQRGRGTKNPNPVQACLIRQTVSDTQERRSNRFLKLGAKKSFQSLRVHSPRRKQKKSFKGRNGPGQAPYDRGNIKKTSHLTQTLQQKRRFSS